MQFYAVNNEIDLKDILNTLPKSFALDCESTDKNPRIAELLKIVIAPSEGAAYSIPARMLPLLRTTLLSAECLILQNFKYDYHLLYLHGLDLLRVPFVDTMLLHHLVDENKDHDLDSMVKEYYEDNYKEVFWSKYKSYEEAPEGDALAYECKDAIYTYKLFKLYSDGLRGREPLVSHVHALAKALYLTEIRGIPVDLPLMHSTKEEMGGRISTYLPKLRCEFSEACEAWEMTKWGTEIAKRKTPKGKSGVKRPEFNFASNNQIQWLLYDHLGLPVLKKTEAKKPATDYETIEKLVVDYPILQTYKDYIDIKTIYGTFVEGLIERVDDGKIYPSFNVNGTVTGRISHSNPNMGNMPKDGPYRNFFLPDPGRSLVGADYSQLEVVIEANLTNDKNLAKIILEGASKHDITNDGMGLGDRDLAKTINFAMGYHCGVRKLSKLLKCSIEEAQYQWNKYWELYKGCRDLKLLTDAEVDSGLPIKNLVGRIRHFPAKFDAEWQLEGAKRQAYNFKIQGPGGDFTNESFYLFSDYLENTCFGRALFSVHDEVVASVDTDWAEIAKEKLIKIMISVGDKYSLKIPLSAKGYGPLARWAKA